MKSIVKSATSRSTRLRMGAVRIIITAALFLNHHGGFSQKSQSFLRTLDIHLDAIKSGNLDKLEPTIANNVSMIGPDGNKVDTKEAFIDFHKSWFALDNWEWKGKILKTENSDSLGYAFIQYRFIQKDTVGNILFQDNEYLVLIFKNSKDGWQLVHDQNTTIQELNKQSN